mmetsp:Transcript_4324/g.10553  ORF Transcript_4324/g.10553 Transcript_4324/m.10553 type:complete len:210 (+) Transcript_4324:574-1203(+)
MNTRSLFLLSASSTSRASTSSDMLLTLGAACVFAFAMHRTLLRNGRFSQSKVVSSATPRPAKTHRQRYPCKRGILIRHIKPMESANDGEPYMNIQTRFVRQVRNLNSPYHSSSAFSYFSLAIVCSPRATASALAMRPCCSRIAQQIEVYSDNAIEIPVTTGKTKAAHAGACSYSSRETPDNPAKLKPASRAVTSEIDPCDPVKPVSTSE